MAGDNSSPNKTANTSNYSGQGNISLFDQFLMGPTEWTGFLVSVLNGLKCLECITIIAHTTTRKLTTVACQSNKNSALFGFSFHQATIWVDAVVVFATPRRTKASFEFVRSLEFSGCRAPIFLKVHQKAEEISLFVSSFPFYSWVIPSDLKLPCATEGGRLCLSESLSLI